jgi:hypothetical protein
MLLLLLLLLLRVVVAGRRHPLLLLVLLLLRGLWRGRLYVRHPSHRRQRLLRLLLWW